MLELCERSLSRSRIIKPLGIAYGKVYTYVHKLKSYSLSSYLPYLLLYLVATVSP